MCIFIFLFLNQNMWVIKQHVLEEKKLLTIVYLMFLLISEPIRYNTVLQATR